MSMQSLERAIVASARVLFENPKLRIKDLQEWSTGEIKAQEGEVVAFVKDPGVYVVVLKAMDKR